MNLTHPSWHYRASLLAAFAVVLWSSVAWSQAVTLDRHAAIYDPTAQRMVVFGGLDDNQSTNNVWQLSLTGDHARSPVAVSGAPPSPRFGHSAIYDPRRHRMIVFGGFDGGFGADLWELSLSSPPTWTRLEPPGLSRPDTRRYHSAVYDPLRDRMIVFGGDHGLGVYFNDVWCLWLGAKLRWEQLSPGGITPTTRHSHSAIYDPIRDRMLVFGGFPLSNDLRALSLGDAPSWTQLSPIGRLPLTRRGHSAIHDQDGDRMLVFGGFEAAALDTVWQFPLAGPPVWSPLSSGSSAPSPRANHTAVYDSAYRRMVVCGGQPNVSEPLWALTLGSAMRWSPARPLLDISPPAIELPSVTIGDTTFVPFLLSNHGLEPLQVSEVQSSIPGLSSHAAAPFDILWDGVVTDTLRLAAVSPGDIRDSIVIVSNDPLVPRATVEVRAQVRALGFDIRVLGNPEQVPLGAAFVVVATPHPGVRVERGTLYYRIADGVSPFESVQLTDFIATIPASAVTEHGVDYYVQIENSGFTAVQPAGAPGKVFRQPVTAPAAITAVPRPTSGSEFLTGREVDVEVLVPAGTVVDSGRIHFRQGGEHGEETVALSRESPLGRPVATIPARSVGTRGVEYWVEVWTLTSRLRFPAVAASHAIVRTKVPNLIEPSEHAGGRYRLLTVPLDFGADFAGSLYDLLVDQVGTYDNTRWRAFWFDPDSLRNVELALATSPSFRPQPGRAFWLISRQSHRIDTSPLAGISTLTGQEYGIPLAPGWNLFGNPFDFPVTWAEVRRNIAAVEDPVAFDPALGRIGEYSDGSPAVLDPFEGYFVHATQAETLWVPAREVAAGEQGTSSNAASTGNRAVVSRSHASDEDSWLLRLTASTESAADLSCSFGVQTGASGGYDALDTRKPPAPPGAWVQVALPHRDWLEKSGLYRRDLRGPGSEGQTWEIEVRSSTAGEPVTLDLSEELPLPPSHGLRIIDREQGSTVDWTSESRRVGAVAGTVREPLSSAGAGDEGIALRHRIISLGPKPYRLSVVAGTRQYVDQVTQPAVALPLRVTLDQNAPNPFRFATRIRFGLPRAEQVDLEIFSLLGQRVAAPLRRSPFGPGQHTVVWDGTLQDGTRAPSGVYLVRLTAGGEALTRRAVFLR